ncbi:MAG: desaturase [Comamonadaceae bacterium]|nr:MAG: desaturase [Comamonadaceae bacterium]
MNVAIVGGGWAGMAAAVRAVQAGHRPTVFEVSRTLGGRARAMRATLPNGTTVMLDNGQHIMIGAYTESLELMRLVGVDEKKALGRMPLRLVFPDGRGIRLPKLPAPLDAVIGVLHAEGWAWQDKLSLLRASIGWQWRGFRCDAPVTVAGLCEGLTPRVMDELIEPLCVSALNLPAARASGQVFLRVIRDSLFSASRGSNLLLPLMDLTDIFPRPAAVWVQARGATVATGERVETLVRQDKAAARGWLVNGQPFDAVILACPPWEAARLVKSTGIDPLTDDGKQMIGWLHRCESLAFEAITTVYATSTAWLDPAMLSLRSSPSHPAQFVFDRGRLGGPKGLLAFVVSASQGDREALQERVMAQGRALGLPDLEALQTVVEKRATFACTPGLQRPPVEVAPGLLACGDYVDGPYPATLEGAVRSAALAVAALTARPT